MNGEEIDVDLTEEEIPTAVAALLAEARDYLVSAGATDETGQRLIGRITLALEHWFEDGEEVSVARNSKAADESGDDLEESGSSDSTEESGDDTDEPCDSCGAEAGEDCSDDCSEDDEDDVCEACGEEGCPGPDDPNCEGDEDGEDDE